MSPPKTDAFADLLSGKLSPRTEASSKLSMGQRLGALGSGILNSSSSKQNNAGHYQDLDMFLGGSSTVSAPQANRPVANTIDVDDLLGVPSTGSLKPNVVNSHTFEGSTRLASSESLLDDEFTDAFTPIPTPHPTPIPIPTHTSKPGMKQPRSQGSSASSRVGSPATPSLSSSAPARPAPRSSDDRRDGILAELVDIGFSVEASNEAIDRCGFNLQSCVNYIMSKAAGDDGTANNNSRPSSRGSQGKNLDNLTKSFNDVSVDIFNKASSLLYKSKRTVIKNLAEFQNKSQQPDNNMPTWMRNQLKYKSNASENKNNGEYFEDYGTDEDNIDQAAIEEFMRKQKQMNKERAKHRFDNLRSSSPSVSEGPSTPKPHYAQERPPRTFQESANSSGRNSRTNSGSSSISNGSRPASRSQTASPAPTAPLSQPQPSRVMESDLLGLGTPLDRFRSNKETQDTMYVSSSRRRPKPASSTNGSSNPSPAAVRETKQVITTRLTVSTPLNQFHQSDYEVSKKKATEFYANGDYQSSLVEYQKCLEPLAENHELRIVILSNLLINLIKLGDYKQALDASEKGLALILKENLNDTTYIINSKPIKAWYTRLLSRKAESLEMLELFSKALDAYTELISLGCNDKKVMDGRRRVNNIINPPPKKPVPAPTRVLKKPQPPKDDSALRMVKAHNEKSKREAEEKFVLYDDVQDRLFKWSNGKEDNIRTLMIALPSILPERLGFPFLTTKKITLNDLMLPKKVKINYMKVIGCLHPDKTQKLNVEDKMICQGVFVILNKSWDIFKEQNGMS